MLFSTFVLCLSFCFALGPCLFVLLLSSAVLFSAAPCWLSSRACKSVLLSGPCVMSSWPLPQLKSVWPFAFTFSFKSLKPVLNHFLTFSFRYFVSFLMFPQTCIIFSRSYSQSSASVQPSKSSASSSSQTACPVSQHPQISLLFLQVSCLPAPPSASFCKYIHCPSSLCAWPIHVRLASSPNYQTCAVHLQDSLLILPIFVSLPEGSSAFEPLLRKLPRCFPTLQKRPSPSAWRDTFLSLSLFFSFLLLWQTLRLRSSGPPCHSQSLSWGITSRHSSPPHVVLLLLLTNAQLAHFLSARVTLTGPGSGCLCSCLASQS